MQWLEQHKDDEVTQSMVPVLIQQCKESLDFEPCKNADKFCISIACGSLQETTLGLEENLKRKFDEIHTKFFEVNENKNATINVQ